MSDLILSVGDRMRVTRQHAGLTQVAMARRLGISRTTIGAYESGKAEPARVILIGWAHETGAELTSLEGAA